MPEGVVVGGWEFISAAYAITIVVLALYTWSLFARLRRFDKKGNDD